MTTWHAQWIWLDQSKRRPQNQTIIARKSCELPALASATLAISADSQYRLFINGQWVEDGPCRSWPKHYQYDVLDVTALLRPGKNVVAVVACHYGVATFHRVPQEAGLLVQLNVTSTTGEEIIIASDESWRVRESPAHLPNTARVSCQMGQTEWYDATLELLGATGIDCNDAHWPTARAYYPAEGGPWQDLHPRDVRFLTREPIFPQRITDMQVVRDVAKTVTFDMRTLCYPDDYLVNWLFIIGVLSTVLISDRDQQVEVVPQAHCRAHLTLNGETVEDNVLHLHAGENLLSILCYDCYGHGILSYSLAFRSWEGIMQRNPYQPAAPNPWGWVGPFHALPTPTSNRDGFPKLPEGVDPLAELAPLGAAPDAETLRQLAGERARIISTREMLQHDAYFAFLARRVQHSARPLITDAKALLADNQEWMAVQPAKDGDIEICLDFGKETVGWLEFELVAKAGTVVDAHLIEYRDGENLQDTGNTRNGFRYITHDGVNHFVSMKRRAGRYLFLTLREMSAPVKIRMVRMVQATYPVEKRGAFRCSDTNLDRIWEMSAYTLQLCMEDTFTDCPLYEQTLWVGDARNESLYNTICFGADDLTRRCLRLTAQSLDDLPLTGCQVPSGWNAILPAWSFLWGINVWEYYFSSGDLEALRELYPAVMKNLRTAQSYCTDRGLFSMPVWNMFDWAGIDSDHRTVVHNSLFLIGAIDAAKRCCSALKAADGPWLNAFRDALTDAVLALWDDKNESYPDAIRDDGSISPSVCQHTSALALLYDAVPDGKYLAALRNITDPPEDMVRVGSPFALQFFLEALEKAGDAAHALALIREKWQDMLANGATTCWETFPGHEKGMLTRSHCHAWSSAPVYVFNRLLLGIEPTTPGAASVVVSPHPLDLEWAEGCTASPHGDLHVAWRKEHGTLHITVDMPEGVAWRVEYNADWNDITRVFINGVERPNLLSVLV